MYLLLYELFVYPRLGPDLVEERPLASLLARSHPPNLALVNRGGWKSILHKIHDNGWFKFRNSKFDVWQHLVFFKLSTLFVSHCFYGRTKLTQKSMIVPTYWPYYSKIERKENYRMRMAACVWKVYDNDKNNIHLGQRPPRCWGSRLQPTKPVGKPGTAQAQYISQIQQQTKLLKCQSYF